MEYVTLLGCLTLHANVLLVLEAQDVKKVGNVTSVRQSTDHKASISKLKHFNAVAKKLCPLFELQKLAAFITVEKSMFRQVSALHLYQSESKIPNVLQILSQTPCLILQP